MHLSSKPSCKGMTAEWSHSRSFWQFFECLITNLIRRYKHFVADVDSFQRTCFAEGSKHVARLTSHTDFNFCPMLFSHPRCKLSLIRAVSLLLGVCGLHEGISITRISIIIIICHLSCSLPPSLISALQNSTPTPATTHDQCTPTLCDCTPYL